MWSLKVDYRDAAVYWFQVTFFFLLVDLNKLLIILNFFLLSFHFRKQHLLIMSNHDIERIKSLLGTHEDFPQKVLAKECQDIFSIQGTNYMNIRALCSRICSLFSKIPLLLKLSSVTLFITSTPPIPKRLMLLLVSIWRSSFRYNQKVEVMNGRSRCSWFLVWSLDCSSFGCCFRSRP